MAMVKTYPLLAMLLHLVAIASGMYDGGHHHTFRGHHPCRYGRSPEHCKHEAWGGGMSGDPVLVGGDGLRFFFHGHRDAGFCIVSDTHFHIDAHSIGRRGQGRTRDFTWVQSLGIVYGDNTQLYVGANKVGVWVSSRGSKLQARRCKKECRNDTVVWWNAGWEWDDGVDQLALAVGLSAVILPTGKGATWAVLSAGLTITRLADTNNISIHIDGMMKLVAEIVSVSQEENLEHNYGITPDICFADFNLKFHFDTLSPLVSGVLGQTYSPTYKSLLQVPGRIMPTMQGDAEYVSSSLMATDCSVSTHGKPTNKEILSDMKPTSCDQSGIHGMVCRR